MEITFKKLATQFTAFMLLLIPTTLMVIYLIPALKVTTSWPAILLFMYILTLGVLYLLAKSLKKRMSMFVNIYLLVSFGKMMLYAVILFVYAWLNPDDAVSFILTFLVYYIFLLIYEVVVLLRIQKVEK
jgi:hypothetical protein